MCVCNVWYLVTQLPTHGHSLHLHTKFTPLTNFANTLHKLISLEKNHPNFGSSSNTTM